MTDPGCYSMVGQEQEQNVDVILITHEHGDHLHVESLKQVFKKNPEVNIITNTAVSEILKKDQIACTILDTDKEMHDSFGVRIESFPGKHEEIFEEIGQVQNTGYMINNEFFYPGDAYTNPQKKVKILALPVAGPWCRVRDSVLYAKQVQPEVCFPVHDWNIKETSGIYKTAKTSLERNNISFNVLEMGGFTEF